MSVGDLLRAVPGGIRRRLGGLAAVGGAVALTPLGLSDRNHTAVEEGKTRAEEVQRQSEQLPREVRG